MKYRWSYYAIPHIVNYTFWGVIVPIVYYLVQKFPWEELYTRSSRIKILGASIAVGLFHEILTNILWFGPMHIFGIEKFTIEQAHYVTGALPSALISRVLEFWILYGLFAAYDYYTKYKRKQVELAKVESQLSNAQLNALRLQLQPHFLFNTLNTISSLMEINIQEAQRMVSRLGNLLRTVLAKDRRNFVSLREELTFTRNYLAIEQARFSDRLNIQYDIDTEALDAQVPALILQPLVENAIKHGFSNKIGAGTITVHALKKEQTVELRVQDDGQGTDLPLEQLLESGIGLKNVQERLELLYKEQATLTVITQPDHGFEVALILPFQLDVQHPAGALAL